MIHRITTGSFKPAMKGKKDAHKEVDPGMERLTDEVRRVDGFGHISARDVTGDGKVAVIIKGDRKTGMDGMKDLIKRKFKPEQAFIREELTIIESIKVEIDIREFKNVVKCLPRNTSITLDRQLFA